MQNWVFPNQHQLDVIKTLEIHSAHDTIVFPQENCCFIVSFQKKTQASPLPCNNIDYYTYVIMRSSQETVMSFYIDIKPFSHAITVIREKRFTGRYAETENLMMRFDKIYEI